MNAFQKLKSLLSVEPQTQEVNPKQMPEERALDTSIQQLKRDEQASQQYPHMFDEFGGKETLSTVPDSNDVLDYYVRNKPKERMVKLPIPEDKTFLGKDAAFPALSRYLKSGFDRFPIKNEEVKDLDNTPVGVLNLSMKRDMENTATNAYLNDLYPEYADKSIEELNKTGKLNTILKEFAKQQGITDIPKLNITQENPIDSNGKATPVLGEYISKNNTINIKPDTNLSTLHHELRHQPENPTERAEQFNINPHEDRKLINENKPLEAMSRTSYGHLPKSIGTEEDMFNIYMNELKKQGFRAPYNINKDNALNPDVKYLLPLLQGKK